MAIEVMMIQGVVPTGPYLMCEMMSITETVSLVNRECRVLVSYSVTEWPLFRDQVRDATRQRVDMMFNRDHRDLRPLWAGGECYQIN